MNEVWARAALVLGVLLVAGVISLLQRRQRRPMRDIEAIGLPAGVYFFSSASCSTCTGAREKLQARLGDSGFTEFAWEESPGRFADLDVDAVPAVAIVDEHGRGRLYPGQPERALAALR